MLDCFGDAFTVRAVGLHGWHPGGSFAVQIALVKTQSSSPNTDDLVVDLQVARAACIRLDHPSGVLFLVKQLRVLVESQLQEQALRLKRLETLLEQGRARLKENSTPEHIDAAVEGNLEDLAEDRLPRVLRPQSQRRERRGEDDDRRETEERP